MYAHCCRMSTPERPDQSDFLYASANGFFSLPPTEGCPSNDAAAQTSARPGTRLERGRPAIPGQSVSGPSARLLCWTNRFPPSRRRSTSMPRVGRSRGPWPFLQVAGRRLQVCGLLLFKCIACLCERRYDYAMDDSRHPISTLATRSSHSCRWWPHPPFVSDSSNSRHSQLSVRSANGCVTKRPVDCSHFLFVWLSLTEGRRDTRLAAI
jgi:hypothetical protein